MSPLPYQSEEVNKNIPLQSSLRDASRLMFGQIEEIHNPPGINNLL